MPDWATVLRERLGALGLDAEQESEILRELAGHLEDAYQQAVEQGFSPEQAEARALASEEDWKMLRREIQRTAGESHAVASWKKSFWMPGLITVALYIVAEIIVGHYDRATARRIAGPHGGTLLFITGHALQRYVMRNVVPILAGALAAFLASRLRGNFWQRLLAGLFPVAALPALDVLLLVLAPLWGHAFSFHWTHSMLRYDLYVSTSINYVAYVLLGAFPFLAFGGRKASPTGASTT